MNQKYESKCQTKFAVLFVINSTGISSTVNESRKKQQLKTELHQFILQKVKKIYRSTNISSLKLKRYQLEKKLLYLYGTIFFLQSIR